MTPRELIKSAIHFNTPDALPIIYPTQNISDIHIQKGQFGTGGAVEAEAAELLEKWGTPQGKLNENFFRKRPRRFFNESRGTRNP